MENSINYDEYSSNRLYKPRMLSSSNLFTRIDTRTSRCRPSRTSDAMRVFKSIPKNSTLQNSKENLNYASYLSKVKPALKFDEKAVVSKCLQALRKQCDQMAKSIKQQKCKINMVKKDIRLIKTKSMFLDSDITSLDQNIIEKENSLVLIAEKQDNVLMEAKTLSSIIQRMKKDELFYKNKKRVQEQEVKRVEKENKMYEEMVSLWDDNIHKLLEKEKKMKEICGENTEDRQRKLADYEERLEFLQDKEKFQFQRKERTYELLSIQTNDILDAKNVVMRDVYMTNKLLDKLLRGKIASLLMKYQTLQNAFHRIKTETSIYNPHQLQQKFFSYSQLSENLLQTISLYEEKQKKLIKNHEKLKKKAHQIQSKSLEEEKSGKAFAEFRIKKNMLLKETAEKNLLIKKIKEWIQKKTSSVYPDDILKESMHSSKIFQDFCCKIKEQSFKVECSELLTQHKFQGSGIRVKKLVKQLSLEDEKLRKSQAQEMNQNNLTESLYLSHERQKIKKHQYLIKANLISSTKQ